MSKPRTRLVPRELSEPVPLTDSQVEALKSVLSGFRELYFVVDDNVPAGPEKEAMIRDICQLKMRADACIRCPPQFTLRRFSDLLATVEAEDKMVVAVAMNSVDFSDLRMDKAFSDAFDPSTARSELVKGLMGSAFNASIFVSSSVPAGHVVLFDDEDEAAEVGPEWKPSEGQLIEI